MTPSVAAPGDTNPSDATVFLTVVKFEIKEVLQWWLSFQRLTC